MGGSINFLVAREQEGPFATSGTQTSCYGNVA